MREKWAHLTPANAPRVAVGWRDIRDTPAWDDDEEPVRPARRLETLGWLLYEGPDPEEPEAYITVIARTYDWEEKRWCEYTTYPQIVVRGLSNG